MAGERSKSIGEVGEQIAEKFFNKIGWGLPQKGVYFPCYNQKKHALKNSKSGEKTQHGIDFLISYRSSLEAETINNLVVSVKHTKDENYPKSATEKFKGFISDLVHSLECFQRSPIRQEASLGFKDFKVVSDIPVLFYISSNNDENHDFVSCLQTSNFMSDHNTKELYVVDNMRVTFILNVLAYIESKYADYDWYFYHPTTSLNISDTNIQRHNKTMQVEFLTSPMIPFLLKKKIGDEETYKFFLGTTDTFTQDNFAKLITYCRENSNDIVSDIEISMPDYFADDFEREVVKILNVNERQLAVKVSNYNPNFRSLAND